MTTPQDMKVIQAKTEYYKRKFSDLMDFQNEMADLLEAGETLKIIDFYQLVKLDHVLTELDLAIDFNWADKSWQHQETIGNYVRKRALIF